MSGRTNEVIDLGVVLGDPVKILFRPGEELQHLFKIRHGQFCKVFEGLWHVKAVFLLEGLSFRRIEQFVLPDKQGHGIALQREPPIILGAQRVCHVGIHHNLVIPLNSLQFRVIFNHVVEFNDPTG